MRILLFSLFCLVCNAQQPALLSGKSTVPIRSSGSGITNTTAGLVNWWKFDDNTGTTAIDSGSAGDATATLDNFESGAAAPNWVSPGKIGAALNFDGEGGRLYLATNTISGSDGMTVSWWMYRAAPSLLEDQSIIYDSDADASAGYYITLWGNTLEVAITFDGHDVVRTTVECFPLGAWIHTTATWDGTTSASGIHIYTNSVECAYSVTSNGSGSHSKNTTSGFLNLNRQIGNNRSTAYFGGKLDDLRIYDRVLNSGERTNVVQWRGEP